jgi:hypothetical protein
VKEIWIKQGRGFFVVVQGVVKMQQQAGLSREEGVKEK